jgi:hypothetical protein
MPDDTAVLMGLVRNVAEHDAIAKAVREKILKLPQIPLP